MGGACRTPAMAQAMAVWSINSSCRVEDGLVVRIEADDEAAEHPQSALLNDPDLSATLSRADSETFMDSFSASADGVSMPMKTYMKLASTMAASSSGRSARSMEASV